MNVYLSIMVTILVITQIVRVTQNHISLFRQAKKIDEQLAWFNENDITMHDFEAQREVTEMLHQWLQKEIGDGKK